MPTRVANKVLLIGWDAADWQFIRPLVERGMMPALAKFIEEGASGNLATIQPALSPMLWNSIATGKRADKHGIFGFVEPQPDRSGIRPVSSTSRKCKAIWNILSQSGLTSQVVSWFASHPAEPICGSVVTNQYVMHSRPDEGGGDFPAGTFHPASLRDLLAPLIVRPDDLDADALLPFVPRAAEIDHEHDDRLYKLARLLAQTSTVHAAACRLMLERPWDFMAVYYSGIDEFGHFFMPYHPPRLEGISERDAEIYSEVMTGCYRFHDMMLESLLAYAGEDTTVILVSDHGFQGGRDRPDSDAWKQPVRWHRPFGIACVKGPKIRARETLYGASLLDVTPTILTLFGLPIGRDMDGRPWLEIINRPVMPGRIPTWETVDGESGQHSAEMREDPVESAAMVRQLVDLGYIEPPSDDVEDSIRQVLKDQRINLAVALTSSRRAAAAVPIWQELVEEDPTDEMFAVQLALGLLSLGRIDECRATIDRFSTNVRESPYVRLLMAKLALNCDDRAEALRLANALAEEKSLIPGVLNALGDVYLQLKSWDQAAAIYGRSLGDQQDNPVAHDGLAQVHVAREEFGPAVEHSLKAVGFAHYFPTAHFHLGVGLRELGRESEAIAAFETSLTMGYNPAATHRYLAMLLHDRDPVRSNFHRQQAGYE